MDYVVGSIAALISGNVTPNRPKLIRRALTPTKHQSSPNVTPKSEFVEDRSIFLSPTLQKKKAIVKKSPKRIFANPDLDITENTEITSPKADKVKKHLTEELEADEMAKTKSPSNKLDKSLQPLAPSKSKTNDSQDNNENTPKKKRKSESVAIPKTEEMDVDKSETVVKAKSSKKERRKSVVDDDAAVPIVETEVSDAAKEPEQTANVNQEGKKKKKRKKKNKANTATKAVENENADKENKTETTDNKTDKSPKKKKNRKKNKKLIESPKEKETVKSSDEEKNKENDVEEPNEEESKVEENDSDEEVSNIANPNAITEKDTDSEHDSDDEIESEKEEDDKVLKNDDPGDSSDEEKEAKTQKGAKKNKKEVKEDKKDKEGTSLEREVNTEEEVKRTLFVGNVLFSNKCKKEIKKIFAQYGEIETVRIRTVPVKDARVTPKLAVIKNEIHPDRSTVNVYVKFTDPSSVERALAENNTVLNDHHLRVSRSGSTGVEHDPRCAVFLGNLPFGIEDETLRARFEKCGEIHSVRIVRDKKTNAGKGFGYVNFTSKDSVELALSLTEEDLTVKNRIIRVKRCTQTLSKGPKNKSVKPGPRKDFGNNQTQNRNFGNNQGQNRSFGNNQGQNRNVGNQRNFNQNRNQGQNRNFGNNQGQNRNFGNNQGPRNFGNNQGPRNFGNNQGPRNFGNNQNRFGNQTEASGASRRLMNKRPHQESGDGPPSKKQNTEQPPREKKQRKEFVGVTAEKKKKQKFDKNQKKKKAISEIMTKK